MLLRRRRRARRLRRRRREEDRQRGGAGLVARAVDGHGHGRVVVFEAREVGAPEFAGAQVPVVEFGREGKVDALDVFGEEGGAGAEADGEELGGGRGG